MARSLYIEVDGSQWRATRQMPQDLAALANALERDGWETAKVRDHRRLFARRFTSNKEYRAALASARFTVAQHLAERTQTPC
jgi:alkanesulfonate monooxygenase SsuD/methylene tetrahydromethanopterin reductase-like flavin-dependent oxidoreductase (luciferase family)